MTDKDPETPTEEPRAAKPRTPWQKSERVRLVAFILVTLVALGAVALVGRARKALPVNKLIGRIETELRRGHRPKLVRELKAACKQRGCDCAKKAANLGLEMEANDAVFEIVEVARASASGPCTPSSAFDAFEAEGLVRSGKDQKGAALAADVLTRDAQNPNALYAQALLNYHSKAIDKAKALAERAVAAGRGSTAHLLLGLMAFHTGDLPRARAEFTEMLKADPDDIDALYNLGTVAQKLERYGDARSSYLKVTRIAPKHLESRYNLGILAHSIGADEEARHHLEKLRTLPRSDALARKLEAALAVPPEHPPAHVLKLDAPPATSAVP